jgi:repressor LexA
MIKKTSTYYALRAKGDSMIDVGIETGDMLLIRSQDDVDDGEIAVVISLDSGDERATLKRVYHKPRSLLLKAENSKFPSVYVKDCIIRGKLA